MRGVSNPAEAAVRMHMTGWKALGVMPLVLACAGETGIPGERGEICADVRDVRVCWGCGAKEPVCLVAHEVPGPVPRAGWRCEGAGAKRSCVDRAAAAGPFSCGNAREHRNGNVTQQCVSRHPRMPDDGEWECADVAGAVTCRGGEPAAGVTPGPPDVGWRCGTRMTEAGANERICLDLSPDLPPGDPHDWTCRFDYGNGVRRICERPASTPSLGSPCRDGCPEGATCELGRCLPPGPNVSCWLDSDCPSGTGPCRFGSCAQP